MYSVKKITLLGIVIVMSVSFSMMNVDRAYGQGSPVYLGEYCWEGGGGFIRVGLTHMGEGHISVCGTASQTSFEWAVTGNLEVVGSIVLGTSTEAGTLYGGTYMFSRISDIVLDLSTLNGTANFMVMTWDDEVCSLDHYSFDLTYVDCETELSSDGVDKREELIRFLRLYSRTPEENLD
jgi:hypothetical protein